MTTDERLIRIEEMLHSLVQQRTVKKFYSTAEVAEILGKAEFTIREHCRNSRIAARKASGRGEFGEWRISHEELTRLRNEGLLPDPSRVRPRRIF